jgi:hypothetical protein
MNRTRIQVSKLWLFVWASLIVINIQAKTELPEAKRLPKKWAKDGISILLKDDLNLPNMSWPLTLLEYPVDFTPDPIGLKDLVLIDKASDQTIPFQFSEYKLVNGKIQTAVLCFLSDLPQGVKKEFRLTKKKDLSNLSANISPTLVSVVSK